MACARYPRFPARSQVGPLPLMPSNHLPECSRGRRHTKARVCGGSDGHVCGDPFGGQCITYRVGELLTSPDYALRFLELVGLGSSFWRCFASVVDFRRLDTKIEESFWN